MYTRPTFARQPHTLLSLTAQKRFEIVLQAIGLWLIATSAYAQTPADSVVNKRLWIAGGAVYAGSMAGLNALWYKDFPRTSFHTFNDNTLWLGLDKAGHALTAYHINDAAHRALVGSGVERKRAAWQAAGVSFAYLTSIEVLDGFSQEWGFSIGDQVANTAGIGLFLAQEVGWQDQRLRLKYSYLPSEFADLNPSLLGADWTERWLKDYNGQTYWLSVNPRSFSNKESGWWPTWLNIAAGYGGTGMLTGRGQPLDPLSSYHPVRESEYYLSLDIDLTRIQTRHRALRIFLDALGFVKVPAPGLRFSPSDGLGVCAICG